MLLTQGALAFRTGGWPGYCGQLAAMAAAGGSMTMYLEEITDEDAPPVSAEGDGALAAADQPAVDAHERARPEHAARPLPGPVMEVDLSGFAPDRPAQACGYRWQALAARGAPAPRGDGAGSEYATPC
jgi:hypothetical protein